jgi:RNA polymerase primary sigma factor
MSLIEENLRRRARRLLRTEVEFVPNHAFHSMEAGHELTMLSRVEAGEPEAAGNRLPKGLPPHLGRLCEPALLSAERERELFLQMNYLKYRANSVRSRLDPDQPDAEAVDRCERLLKAADVLRDRIIRANLRLVIAVVKKFVTPQHSFDDMLSDGMYSLMQAVDKFDYDRGFRFSTYAYRAIARNAYRAVTDRYKDSTRFATGAEEAMAEAIDERTSSTTQEHAFGQLRDSLSNLLDRLDRRERFIIRSRYALGAHRRVRTFQCLADKLGVSKERVRQLEQRAVAKLRTMVADLRMHETLETAIA